MPGSQIDDQGRKKIEKRRMRFFYAGTRPTGVCPHVHGRTVLHVHQTDSMADMHLWVKGFAHYIAFGGSRVAKTTFSTFIILAHEGPNGEQLKF